MLSIDWTPVTEFVGRNWLFTLMFGAICALTKIVFNLYGEKATLEAKILVLQESNSDLKKDFKEQVTAFKAENLQLQKTIQEKCTDDALFSKYDVSQGGVLIHKTSQKPHCPACFHTSKREVQLQDDPTDSVLRCTVDRNHYFDNPNYRRPKHLDAQEGPWY